MKVAKLVYLNLVTRVVVDENATEQEIIDVAKERFIDKIDLEIDEHIDDIVDDVECPYNPSIDDIIDLICCFKREIWKAYYLQKNVCEK
jgi:hypothetical protein